MGLFRRRTEKDREKAATSLLNEQTETAKAQAEVARPQVTQVTAEERPNPDRPGWGTTIGQEIGKAREDRPSQE
jgi:hypothetical protein